MAYDGVEWAEAVDISSPVGEELLVGPGARRDALTPLRAASARTLLERICAFSRRG